MTNTWSISGRICSRTAARTCSPRRAKSAARIDGAILALDSSDASCGTGVLLERIHKLAVAAGNFVYRFLSRDLLGSPVYECIPETRPADREPDEPGNAGRRGQPLLYFLVVLAA